VNAEPDLSKNEKSVKEETAWGCYEEDLTRCELEIRNSEYN